ncbi:protein lethal(2)essential for life [Anabrus simplex]|uniref:protein lethal(2)essential for life n=1 Tax=Anabrus simplex TaxID=316456 RepID=UPI0035A36408
MILLPHLLCLLALHPLVMSDVYDDWDHFWSRPSSLFDQNFGLGLLADELLHPHHSLMYYRPWRHQSARHSGFSNIQYNDEGFKVNLDVQQFKPEEVVVKTVGNSLVIEGKHEERKDPHGFISRQFKRRYILPDDVDPETVTSKLSSDGILTIEAPRKELPPIAGKERVIAITHTDTPALTQGEPEEVTVENEDKS